MERLAVVSMEDSLDAAVVFRAGDPPAAVLAGDEPALPIPRIAVGVVGRSAEHADLPGLLLPFQDAVVRNIAPQQIATVAEPDRSFAPAHPAGETLDRRAEDPVLGKARIEHFDDRVGIAPARRPRAR